MIPADFSAVHAALYTWLFGQVGLGGEIAGLAAAPYTVIWGYQDGARPAHPYAVLSWASPFATIGGKPHRSSPLDEDDEPLHRIEYDAEATLRVELLTRATLDSNGLDETMALLAALEASLFEQTEVFDAAGIAFVETRGAFAIPGVVGFGHERRARLDVVLRARVRVDRPVVGVFDSTTIDDIEGTTDEDGAVIGIVGST